MGRYTFPEDSVLADCAMEVEGSSLDDLFETAAMALACIMVDPTTVAMTVERAIALDADELDILLYDWLSELIFLKDRDGEVFPSARVRVTGKGPYQLRADLHGGRLDRSTTALGADPKAVTLHRFALEPVDGGWRATVVIDI
ncbi:MAG TPA: archease [Candidatus Methylomirabilis sp.]|nr:archease [Candidatus Methylomirabilis sp.]